ncbi:MAG: hypothetical protein JWL97_4194 [Gemmatimonadales bacterium]|nr:hypothetical protein [Gemmatimonadales bacterium]
MAELDEDAADDLIVIEGETYPGEPRGGYWWNDLREEPPDLVRSGTPSKTLFGQDDLNSSRIHSLDLEQCMNEVQS